MNPLYSISRLVWNKSAPFGWNSDPHIAFVTTFTIAMVLMSEEERQQHRVWLGKLKNRTGQSLSEDSAKLALVVVLQHIIDGLSLNSALIESSRLLHISTSTLRSFYESWTNTKSLRKKTRKPFQRLNKPTGRPRILNPIHVREVSMFLNEVSLSLKIRISIES